jgi:hypothetical protein
MSLRCRRGEGSVNRSNAPEIGLVLVALMLLQGCHSATFQTAKTRSGVGFTGGVTRVEAGNMPRISEYSVFLKGDYGRSATTKRYGYCLGFTFLAPFENDYREGLGDYERGEGTFPNEWVGFLPEVLVQFPRRLPFDLAVNLRLMTYMPERLAVIASYDIGKHVTPYGSLAYVTAIGGLMSFGAEISLSRRLGFMVEYSGWLSEHEYPEGNAGEFRRYPYSVGIGVRYFFPRLNPPDNIEEFTRL